MNDELVKLMLYVIILVYGLQYIFAYIFGRTMYIPGETLRNGEKPFGRLFIFMLGIVIASWAGYSLLNFELSGVF